MPPPIVTLGPGRLDEGATRSDEEHADAESADRHTRPDRRPAELSGLHAPFSAGSVSFRSYPNQGLDPTETIDELRAQAALAVERGFDGVMTSEHHGGFAGYLPNPLQLAGFLLDAMPRGWAAPCPLLLPLRPAALVAEETAWLAARFPGRVGLGVAAGALAVDFEIMGVPMDGLTARFASGLELVAGAMRGAATGALAADLAIARCLERPIPVLSAAASVTAARRAARVGAGLLFDSLVTPERVRVLVDAYREAGGARSCVLVRRAWLGEPSRAEVDRQVEVYRGYAPATAPAHWGADEMIVATGAAEVAERLLDARRVAGADALNLRVHVPGVSAAASREQIAQLGAEVVPRLRSA
jgi:alkanesulfonate monooxygenase SsuD/methylene tetrahydromethanopterin reductase-like flavin-dependent oxidoreductase (luciferase family)